MRNNINNLADLSEFRPSDTEISIFAPISIGNVSVGFDSLGMALSPNDKDKPIGDIVHIKVATENCDSLILQGSYCHTLPKDVKENIVWQALVKFNKAFVSRGGQSVYVDLILEKNIPICSGLGSSSCSIVAALVALNELYAKPFSSDELLLMMGELECVITGSIHYDNLAPSYLGGFQLMLSEDFDKACQSLPIFEDCFWIIAYPDIVVSTRKAREILPKKYSMKTLTQSCQNIAGFIDACYRQDKKQAFSLLVDKVAEPYRESLLDNFKETKVALLDAGCLSVGISGSGPTIFTVTDSIELAEKAKSIMCEMYATSEQSIVEICEVDRLGARLI
ncbi:MAG: homoserine kinase [Kangiella sp.]|nr:MAG: homoserine kinase [Kangiella sp.]